MNGGDWQRVIGYVTQAHEDQRRADEFAARAHAGRVMAKKIIDMKLDGSDRPGGVGAGPAGRHRRAGGSHDGEAGGVN